MNNLLLFVFSLIIAVHVSAQEITIQEPEWIGSVTYVESLNKGVDIDFKKVYGGSLQDAAFDVSGANVGGNRTRKAASFINGKESSLVITKSDTLQFIVRCENQDFNPQLQIEVLVLNVVSGDRQFGVRKSIKSATGEYIDNVSINYTAKRYKNNSYLICITDIPNGEYGIRLLGLEHVLFDFSVQHLGNKNGTNSGRNIYVEEAIKIKENSKAGDIVYFKRNGCWVIGEIFSKDYYGAKVIYFDYSEDKERKTHVDYIEMYSKLPSDK